MALVSIVTFVESTDHISVLHQSLRAQSLVEWEWVVVPIGRTVVSGSVVDDPKVTLFHLPAGAHRAGWAERWRLAAERASGELLVDLDQHDALLPNGLEFLTSAAVGTGAGAVYCDFAPATFEGHARDDGYDEAFGWERFDGSLDGEKFSAVRAFDPTPGALVAFDYAPGPALTWRRPEYERVRDKGGFAEGAGRVDLLCLAYRAGVTLGHVNECLVVSRPRPESRATADALRIEGEHLLPVIEEWSLRHGFALVELGDSSPGDGYAHVALREPDPRLGLPFEDDAVGVIRASDFLQHINHCPHLACRHGEDGGPRCVVGMMNELYRVLAPGGWLLTDTPSTDGRGAFQDPTHCSFWNPNSFWYYTDAHQAALVPGLRCRFQAHSVRQGYPSAWHADHDLPYVSAHLVALKGQRQPGRAAI